MAFIPKPKKNKLPHWYYWEEKDNHDWTDQEKKPTMLKIFWYYYDQSARNGDDNLNMKECIGHLS